jgi:acetylornithine deacetylase
MAAMLLAIRKILNEDGQLPVTVHFAATGDEEDGALGAIQLVESGLRVDGVIVGEPTDLKIVYAHKGACRFRIVLTGKAAHSSIPSLGINAVEAAAELVVMIRNQFPTRLQYRTHSELGPATLCISTINGGNKVNIVPDRCQIEIDCRCLPGEHRAHLEGEMKGLLELLAKSYPGLGTECQIFQWYPAMDGRTADAFVARMTEACGTVTGSRLTETVPYATNGGFFSQATMPCVVFGPGSIANAHTADESVDLAQVEQAVNIYASMIRAFATR